MSITFDWKSYRSEDHAFTSPIGKLPGKSKSRDDIASDVHLYLRVEIRPQYHSQYRWQVSLYSTTNDNWFGPDSPDRASLLIKHADIADALHVAKQDAERAAELIMAALRDVGANGLELHAPRESEGLK